MTKGPHVLIVDARYYGDVGDRLLAGASAALKAAGATFDHVVVPGALELPAAVAMAIEGGRYDGFVALGCVIRGETSHYDLVCNEAARGLNDLARRHQAPIGFGVLTCENGEQARVRADPKGKDKGGEAARACLAMIALRGRLGAGSI
ncbi:MAG: 6,7-dimethyl-8-ribityllumazine synthase [Alphaproteobacteria bacterium]